MAYFELLARCQWLSHIMISMAEGFLRATQSMPIDGFDLLVCVKWLTLSCSRDAGGFPIPFLWPKASREQLKVCRLIRCTSNALTST